jgi:hypothetical protein
VRGWAAAALAAAQLAAVAAGLLPWDAALITLLLTWLVARRHTPAGPGYAKAAQVGALVLVCAVGLHVVIGTRTALAGDSLDPVTTLRSLSWVLILLSLAMAPSWHTVRDYRAWIGVTAGILIASAAPPDPGGRADPATATLLVAWGVLLVAVVMVQRAALLTRAAAVAIAAEELPQPSRALAAGATLVVPVIASIVAGILVFLALPGTLGGGGLSIRLAHDLHHSSDQPFVLTRGTAGVDTIGTGDLDLRVRGSLAATPLLRVPAHSPALWRGTIYSTYTGQSWRSSGYPIIRFNSLEGDNVALTPPATDLPAVGAAHRRYLVQPQGNAGFSLVWAPGVLLRVSGPRVRGVARSSAFTRVVSFPANAPYTVTAAVPSQSPARLTGTPAVASPDGQWTSLPTELPARVSTLARTATAGAANRYQQVVDLETYLRRHETYSLTSPVPTGNQDAVDDFLFRDHIGFCEQFASAEAVMLRTLGVPARVVSGLAYGVRQGSTRLLRSSDAHAWVEVYYPHVGWVPTDPTAGVRLAPATAASGSWLSTTLRRLTDVVPGGGLGILVILIVAALTTAGSLRIVRRRPGLRTGSAQLAHPTALPVLAAFLRFAARRPRASTRAPTETAREYVGRAGATSRLGSAVATLERESYGAAGPDDGEARTAVAAFDELR